MHYPSLVVLCTLVWCNLWLFKNLLSLPLSHSHTHTHMRHDPWIDWLLALLKGSTIWTLGQGKLCIQLEPIWKHKDKYFAFLFLNINLLLIIRKHLSQFGVWRKKKFSFKLGLQQIFTLHWVSCIFKQIHFPRKRPHQNLTLLNMLSSI